MLVIRNEQRMVLLNDLKDRNKDELIHNICKELRIQASQVMEYDDSDKIKKVVSDVVEQCYSRDIFDENQILNLCYIQILTNSDIFEMEAFSYLIKNELMHPYAKARHLIESFFCN